MSRLRDEHKRISSEDIVRSRTRNPRLRNDLHVPQDIMLNILSRLPAESVLECRLVCKSWSKLPVLNDNHFADMHLRRRLRGLLLLQYQDEECHHHHYNSANYNMGFVFLGYTRRLYYVECGEQSFTTSVTKINLPQPFNIHTLVGSCNGLICLTIRYNENLPVLYNESYSNVDDHVYILNPITREYVNLPRCFSDNDKDVGLVHGFGYHPITKEYKVVRIYYYCLDKGRPYIGQVQVYTLGSGGGWRNIGEVPYPRLRPTSMSVLLNGALHWFAGRGEIVAFDLADEEFHLLPTPHFSYSNGLWVLGGWLCLFHARPTCSTDIWLLKKNDINESSTSSYDMNAQKYQSWSWSKEFTIAFGHMNQSCQLLALTKSGEILLLHEWPKTIVCYNPKTATSRELGNLHRSHFPGNVLVSHFNSFVSLKALGENASKSLREHPNIIGSAADRLDCDTNSTKRSRSFKKKRSF